MNHSVEKLRILILEDVSTDAELMENELREAGLSFVALRVETREAFLRALEEFTPRLILADYQLPSFDGRSALQIVRETHPELPVILVSGVLGESAVELLKEGARDYVLKDHLARLAPAVRRALADQEDVRARKRAEAALRESEAHFRRLAAELEEAQRLAHVGSWELNPKTGTVLWSKEIYRIFGRDPDLPAPSYPEHGQILTVESLERLDAAIEKLNRTGEVFELDLQIIRPDGSNGWITARGEAKRNGAGQIEGLRGTALDITERKRLEEELRQHRDHLEGLVRQRTAELETRNHQLRDEVVERGRAEQALRESESRFRSVLENSIDAAYRWNLQTEQYDYMSPAIERILGYSVEEFSAMSAEDRKERIHPDDLALAQQKLERSFAGEKACFGTAEYRLRGKDGEFRWLADRFTLMRDEVNASLYRVGIIRDITLRKRYQEEIRLLNEDLRRRATELESANARLQELDRLKSLFIAAMSHELRTPLNSIIGFTGIILQGMTGDVNEEQRKQLTIVKESAHHLLSLINDIIDISKIESGKVDLAIGEFDLAEVVREVAGSFAVVVQLKGLELAVTAPESVWLESDRRRAKQILVNLVGNAVKFTDHGRIEIGLNVTEDGVEVAVQDTGIGIKKEDSGKLFTAFSQIDTEGRQTEGTGLGLYLSQKIAHVLRGRLTAMSEFGTGSTFTLFLPSHWTRSAS